MSIRTPVDFKYGRLHVRSEKGLAVDTDIWVEDEDGNKIGLPATSVTLFCEKQGLWSAVIETVLVRVDVNTSGAPVLVQEYKTYRLLADDDSEDSPDSDISTSLEPETHLVSTDVLDDATLDRGVEAIRRVGHEPRPSEGETLSEGRGD